MAKNEYIVCPLCGWNKILTSIKRLEKDKPEYLQWASLDLTSVFILQVREGGGKKAGTGAKGRGKAPGSGFKLVPSESLTLAQMLDDSSYSEILSQMRDQLLTVIRQSLELGFIRREEI